MATRTRTQASCSRPNGFLRFHLVSTCLPCRRCSLLAIDKSSGVEAEKKAAKFKICAEFAELKLKSLPAASLVDKAEAWLYDTKKRKLIHVVADEYAKVFTVKNNAIVGFNPTETVQKTVRKPAETLKALSAAGKPSARKLFKELTTTETQFNGRGTENIVILKSW